MFMQIRCKVGTISCLRSCLISNHLRGGHPFCRRALWPDLAVRAGSVLPGPWKNGACQQHSWFAAFPSCQRQHQKFREHPRNSLQTLNEF